MFAWLAVQMLALLAAALRVSFSARFPMPAERLAMHEMLVVQTVASAMLFPILFRGLASTILVIASAPLMALFAAALAAETRDRRLIAFCVLVCAWLVALAMWSWVLRTTRARLYGVAAALLLALGGVVVAYLNREFGGAAQTFEWHRHALLGPIMAGLALLETNEVSGPTWEFVGAAVLSGALACGVRWARRRSGPAVS